MDQFERQFEHLDVQTQSMEEAMSGVTTLSTPEVSLLVLGLNCLVILICSFLLGPSNWFDAAGFGRGWVRL